MQINGEDLTVKELIQEHNELMRRDNQGDVKYWKAKYEDAKHSQDLEYEEKCDFEQKSTELKQEIRKLATSNMEFQEINESLSNKYDSLRNIYSDTVEELNHYKLGKTF